MDEPRKWILEMESAPDGDAVKTGAVTTKDLESYINLAEKAAAGFKRTDSNSERNSVGETLEQRPMLQRNPP